MTNQPKLQASPQGGQQLGGSALIFNVKLNIPVRVNVLSSGALANRALANSALSGCLVNNLACARPNNLANVLNTIMARGLAYPAQSSLSRRQILNKTQPLTLPSGQNIQKFPRTQGEISLQAGLRPTVEIENQIVRECLHWISGGTTLLMVPNASLSIMNYCPS
jgi:hypothetical protein